MVGTPGRPPRSSTPMGYCDDDGGGQVGLSISRVPTPALPASDLVAVDLGDLPPTSMAPALMEDGHGGGAGGRGASWSVDEKRAPSEATVATASDELSSATSCE